MHRRARIYPRRLQSARLVVSDTNESTWINRTWINRTWIRSNMDGSTWIINMGYQRRSSTWIIDLDHRRKSIERRRDTYTSLRITDPPTERRWRLKGAARIIRALRWDLPTGALRRSTRRVPRARRICVHVIARPGQCFLIANDPVMESALPDGHLTGRCETRNHPRRALFRPADHLTEVGLIDN